MPTRPFLDNPHSDRVRRIAALARPGPRARTGLFLAEGPGCVGAAVQAGAVVDLYVHETDPHPQLCAAALAREIYVHPVSGPVMQALSPNAQGILAVARQLAPTPQVLETARFTLVCVDVRDPGNAGTVIRVADAVGADAVVFAGHSVDLYNPKVVRASAGSIFHVPVITSLTVAAAVDVLRAGGCRIVATSGGAPTVLGQARVHRPIAWLFGNEAHGLGPAALAAADEVISIPIFGAAESLNLAAAVAVCAYATALAEPR